MEQSYLITGRLAPSKDCLGLEMEAVPVGSIELMKDRVLPKSHFVAFGEACVAAVRLAIETEAKSLVLLSPYFNIDASLKARLQTLEQAAITGQFRSAAKPWFCGQHSLETSPAWLEAWNVDSADLLASLQGLLQLEDQRKWLRMLRCPVLVAVGAEDVFTPLRYGREVTEWIPQLRGILVTIDGAGHFAPWENPGETQALVRGFIQRSQIFMEGSTEWND